MPVIERPLGAELHSHPAPSRARRTEPQEAPAVASSAGPGRLHRFARRRTVSIDRDADGRCRRRNAKAAPFTKEGSRPATRLSAYAGSADPTPPPHDAQCAARLGRSRRHSSMRRPDRGSRERWCAVSRSREVPPPPPGWKPAGRARRTIGSAARTSRCTPTPRQGGTASQSS
jgi:hypothetical protein